MKLPSLRASSEAAAARLRLRENMFEGYASLFGKPDMSGDVVASGAFRVALRKRDLRNVRMLFQHDPVRPVGVWHEIREDDHGLFVRGQLLPEVQQARELVALLRAGALEGLSIGFKTKRARHDRVTGRRHLLEVDLWEISLVTFPMLPEARVHALKMCGRPVSVAPILSGTASAGGCELPGTGVIATGVTQACRQLRQATLHTNP